MPLAVALGLAFAVSGCIRSQSSESGSARDRVVALADSHVVLPDSFARPDGVAVSDEAIFVSDIATQHVLRLNAEGVLQGMYGRAGSGPGELRNPAGIAVNDSLLAVVDLGNGRISLFARRTGRFIRVVPLPYVVMSVGVLPDGQLVLPSPSDSCAFAILDRSGSITLAGRRPALPPGVTPIFPRYTFAARSDLILTSGDTVLIADVATGSLTAYSVDGALLKQYWIPSNVRSDIRLSIERAAQALGNRVVFTPMFDALVRGSDGGIWLTLTSSRIAALRIDPHTWTAHAIRLAKPTYSGHTAFAIDGRLEMVTDNGLRIFP